MKKNGKSKITKELIGELIDRRGRRKYFRKLDPKLQDAPVKIDLKLIKKKWPDLRSILLN